MVKRIIICLILSFLSCSVYSSDSDDTVLNNYVHKLVNDGLGILDNKNLDQDTKITKVKALILANLDLKWMAKFALGNYRNTLTNKQIEQFTEVYPRYVSKAYADLVKNYKGQTTKIGQIRVLDKGEFMVEMLIGTAKVNYLVRQVKDQNGKIHEYSQRRRWF
jgi:phospholipid transport system substrate-binding protein